jgi:hypothetical protein
LIADGELFCSTGAAGDPAARIADYARTMKPTARNRRS